MPYSFLSSSLFSFNSVSPVFLLWKGSNEDASNIMQSIGEALFAMFSKWNYPFTVEDRFSYIANRTQGRERRPSSMNVFQNVRGIIYTGYSVGCSGLAELYSLGDFLQNFSGFVVWRLCQANMTFCVRRTNYRPFSEVLDVLLRRPRT
jgi:hypothetical protein